MWTGLGICLGKIYLRACLAECIFFPDLLLPSRERKEQVFASMTSFLLFLFFASMTSFLLQSCYLEKQN
jgi:hypothetical protein